MSTLTGPEIRKQMELGNIVIDPLNPELVGPNSVDVHLSDEIYIYNAIAPRFLDNPLLEDGQADLVGRICATSPLNGGRVFAIDSKKPPELLRLQPTVNGGWLLEPGRLYLGSTKEWTETYGYKPVIDGRSTAGRLGLFVHVTAGQGDNGFRGCWTLELLVVEPLIIYPGQRLCQLTYETLEGDPVLYGDTKNSSGRYQGYRRPVPSKSTDS